MIVETDKLPNRIINKNLLKFEVKGALDFSETLYIEMYSDETIGAEEIPINDFEKKLSDAYPGFYHYFHIECYQLNTEHHFNVRPKSIWVICKNHFRHSHESWNSAGRTNKLTFDEAIDLLSGEFRIYEIEPLGYRFDNKIEDLEEYYNGDIKRYVYVNKKTLRKKKLEKISNHHETRA